MRLSLIKIVLCLILLSSVAGQWESDDDAPEETPAPTTPGPTESPTPEPTPAPTQAPTTQSPTAMPTTPSPTEAPTLAPTRSPTLSPTPSPTTAPTLAPTPQPTFSKAPTLAPTPAPTPPPTFSYSSYCERPYAFTNESDVACVELVNYEDREAGGGAFYDEEGCAWQTRGMSSIGCDFGGVARCRLCVFNRALYSAVILNGLEVPYVDCPCCVPDTYDMGGDIDCDFQQSAPPIPVPLNSTPAPITEPPTLLTTKAPLSSLGNGDSVDESMTLLTPAPIPIGTPAPTIPPIPMEPCEIGAEGATNGDACVDLASTDDMDAGIGYYYEMGCAGLGCDIGGNVDCRQCLFDRTAYANAGLEGMEDHEDCPCCVPISYKLRPDDTQCIWPPTPAPTLSPAFESEAASNGVVKRHGRGGYGTLIVPSLIGITSLVVALAFF